MSNFKLLQPLLLKQLSPVGAAVEDILLLDSRIAFLLFQIESIRYIEVDSMNMFDVLNAMFQYLTEGATEIFSPNHDEYPSIGVQPFDGEPLSQWVDLTNIKN